MARATGKFNTLKRKYDKMHVSALTSSQKKRATEILEALRTQNKYMAYRGIKSSIKGLSNNSNNRNYIKVRRSNGDVARNTVSSNSGTHITTNPDYIKSKIKKNTRRYNVYQ